MLGNCPDLTVDCDCVCGQLSLKNRVDSLLRHYTNQEAPSRLGMS